MAIVRTACGSGRAFLVRGRPITHSHCARALPQAVLTRMPGMLDYFQMPTTKILSEDNLLVERARLRAAGQKLVFTNGVFDILHVGHVRYLEGARALGDALVVALNSDRSVRELKGAGRPLMNESERAEILAALRATSYVTIFDDLSPRTLIAELLPDVLVKGGDYTLDEIHGREEVEAAGGRVVSLPFVEGVSSSAIIDRMKK
jgi:rfaE bifunctional protein nucleotidyltransferase chain/domain